LINSLNESFGSRRAGVVDMPDNFFVLIFNTAVSYLRVIIDVSVVAFVFYRILLLIKGTRGEQLLKGILVLVVVAFLSERFQLVTLNWILSQVGLMIVIAVPIVFQPELRRALEQLGRGRLFARPLSFLGVEDTSRLIDEIVRAAQVLQSGKIGALIVIERDTGLKDYIETGIQMDSLVNAEVLLNIFVPGTPLHDGATIIRGDRISAAGCFLPLTDSPYLSRQLGTRHRAALGISEVSDAVSVVVSEETGTISVAEGGKLTRYLDDKNLKELLESLLLPRQNPSSRLWSGGRSS